MRCTHVQSRLLGIPDPAVVPESLRVHLDTCPACQTWHRALLRMEAALPTLPVPVSDGRARAALLRKLQPETPATEHRPAPVSIPFRKLAKPAVRTPRSLAESAARYWPAAAVAATILIGTVAFFSVSSRQPVETVKLPRDPLLDKMVACTERVAVAESSTERVKALAQLAGELHQEILNVALTESADKPQNEPGLKDYFSYYQEVLNGVNEQAVELHGPQARDLLTDLALQLKKAEDDANQKASIALVHTKRDLQDVASAARVARERIRKLLDGRT